MTMGVRARVVVGTCERYFPNTGSVCGKRARYVIYDTRRLCKHCYQRHCAGHIALFNDGPSPSVQELWRFQQRLAKLVPESSRQQ